MHTRYRAIARVVKTHGKRGEVVTVPVHGLPPMLRERLDVTPVPPALKGPRGRVVMSASYNGSGQLVSLGGVSDINAASELVGKVLLARIDDLPEGFERHDVDALLGREVVDSNMGALGSVAEVMVGRANDVWVVRGPYGEVLIPVVDAVVDELVEDGPIRVTIPSGLIEGA
ncbi:ribosome maturation factor RimM [Parafannyhessea umbonata]|uniref:ribosome maturation factor RimM n=1 Tax=Parafannyhessea umbonata TaxID=604330 RepID=UPI000B896A41|nr:16S rRNA processing protein RimM [Parafannyhessea umbonata]